MSKKNYQIPITAEGLKKLRAEYATLLAKRPKMVERLSEARAMGDLKENSEYHHAREELEFADGKSAELKGIIERAVVVERKDGCQSVDLGCKVTVRNQDEKEHDFHIVGEWEADPMERKISHRSPLGSSLLGRSVGERVEVEAPVGKIIYTVVKIN